VEKRKIKSLSKINKDEIKNYSVIEHVNYYNDYYYFVTNDHSLYIGNGFSIIKTNLKSSEAWNFSNTLNKLKRK